MEDLTQEEKIKLANLMFIDQTRPPERQALNELTEDQRNKLKNLYCQKIAYQAVNDHLRPPAEQGGGQPKTSTTPGFISSVCCCLFPEQNRQNFDITSSVFLEKLGKTFFFWTNTFLEIGNGKTELYGPVWLTIAYVIILGIAANLNEYFIKSENYKFNNDIVLEGLGMNLIFRLAEPFIYSAVIKCLGSFISSNQSLMLTGYSVLLYIIPTLFCLIPSMYWHLIMLIVGGFTRTIFLLRNYSTKLDSKTYIMFIVILLIQGLYLYLLLQTMFKNNNGYTIDSGTKQVFGHQMTLRSFSH